MFGSKDQKSSSPTTKKQHPTIGLILKFGEPHETDKKYLLDLKNIKANENLGVQVIDWRFIPQDEKEFFKNMPQGHIQYLANEFIKNTTEKYLASLDEKTKSSFENYKSDPKIKEKLIEEASRDYFVKTGKKLEEDAKEYYKFHTGKSLNAMVDEYLNNNQLDAIYIPGANFEPKAEFCDNDQDKTKLPPDIRREEFERVLVKKAIGKGIPILGVCAGSWLIASCFKGSKTKALTGDALLTHKEGPPEKVDDTIIQYVRLPKHGLVIRSDSMLHGIVRNASTWEATPDKENTVTKMLRKKTITFVSSDEKNVAMQVNSTHWRVLTPQNFDSKQLANLNQEQKIDSITKLKIDDQNQLMISGIDPKHLTIEAFETRFGVPVMGVQFHIEYRIPMLITKTKVIIDLDYPANRRILEAFAEAAMTHANKMKMLKSIPKGSKLKKVIALPKKSFFDEKTSRPPTSVLSTAPNPRRDEDDEITPENEGGKRRR